jgi:hypothetical protein
VYIYPHFWHICGFLAGILVSFDFFGESLSWTVAAKLGRNVLKNGWNIFSLFILALVEIFGLQST